MECAINMHFFKCKYVIPDPVKQWFKYAEQSNLINHNFPNLPPNITSWSALVMVF